MESIKAINPKAFLGGTAKERENKTLACKLSKCK
jgi:hypothetical protein